MTTALTQQPPIATVRIEHYPRLGYAVIFTRGEAWIDFKAVTCYPPNTGLGDVRQYQEDGATCSPKPVPDINAAEVFAHGSVKWDGCSNFTFDDNGTMHQCSRSGLVNIGLMLGYVHDAAGEMMAEGKYLDFEPETTRAERESAAP
jgi:hypothetical protein